jgi:hypothetical protein
VNSIYSKIALPSQFSVSSANDWGRVHLPESFAGVLGHHSHSVSGAYDWGRCTRDWARGHLSQSLARAPLTFPVACANAEQTEVVVAGVFTSAGGRVARGRRFQPRLCRPQVPCRANSAHAISMAHLRTHARIWPWLACMWTQARIWLRLSRTFTGSLSKLPGNPGGASNLG